jgi:flagellar basal body-associated protein FliL
MKILIELLLVLVAAGVATALVHFFEKTKDNNKPRTTN